MLRYIVLRILQVIPVLFGTTLLIYFMVFAMPGDPILALFGDRTPNEAVLERIRAEYHLDQPFIVQYLYYIGGIFTGDLGTSFSGRPVADVLIEAFPVTLRLAILAIAIELVLALVVGAISGLRKGGVFDTTTLVLSLILLSVPIFVTAFIAQYFLGIELGIFRPTVSGSAPWGELVLPAIVLASGNLAASIRLMRASVIDTLNQDFVRTAFSKGLPRARVYSAHVVRNSLIPVITNAGTNLGILIVGATVTEGIFNVPGVGRTLYQAIIRSENVTVVAFVTVLVLLYVLLNLGIDLLYAVLDPRIRYA